MAEHGDPPALGVAVDMPARNGAIVTTSGPNGDVLRGGSVVFDAGVPHARRGLWLALAVVLAAAIGGGWFIWERPLAVRMATVTRGAAIEAVYATGVVEAITHARVGTTVAGRVVAVVVAEGDAVAEGAMLALLDDRQARQRQEDAQARLAFAEQELKRGQTLLATGARPLAQVQQSLRERDQAAAGVELATRQIADYRIVAPFAGIVMRRLAQPGETLAANAALFELAAPAPLRVAADVDEREIAQLHIGQAVAIHADAYPGRAFTASVTNIRREGDSATRTFRVEADLPDDTRSGGGLLIGMTVDVNIVVAERANALLVPAAALRHDPPAGGRAGPAWVFAVVDGRARRVAVTTGAVGADAVEVTGGLDPESTVIADGAAQLRDGQRVRRQP